MTDAGVRVDETYADCERCVRGCNEPWDRDRQAMFRCPVVASARSRWRLPGSGFAVHMGADPDYDTDEQEPHESTEDGCPGGWYRTRFILSVGRYTRPCADGVYSPNLMLDRSDDPLVHEAVAYYEMQQSRHRQWAHEKIQEQRAARG